MDAYGVLETIKAVVKLWHKDTDLQGEFVVLPGGFSYGDYRPVTARFSPIMEK